MPLHPAYDEIGAAALADGRGQARRLIHRASGAEVLTVINDDPDGVFAISFGTLPEDSTGIAHVLEHMVFRGSTRFPVDQPFARLMQGSLAGHVNARTLPDRTVYHAASHDPADLVNLIRVYLDAVFHPLLTDAAFAQEAWNLIPGDPPRLGGIILNEMRGHLAAPAAALAEALRRNLMPGGVYGLGYGGDPDAIPLLQPAALRAFHARFYRPANARLFLWGGGPMAARLDLIDRVLDGLEAGAAAPPVALVVPFASPRRLQVAGPGNGSHFGIGWALPPVAVAELPLLRLAGIALTGLPGAGLLTVGALGRGVLAAGLSAEGVQPTLTIGIEGLAPDRADAAVAAVLDRISAVVRGDVGLVAAAINAAALQQRAPGPVDRPLGLAILESILGPWRHGADPLVLLGQGAADPAALPAAVARWFLDNSHRIEIVMTPGPRPEADAAAIAPRTAVPGPAQPDGTMPAGIGLPALTRADLPRAIRPADVRRDGAVLAIAGADDGIARIDLALDLTGLPEPAVALAPVLVRALLAEGPGGGDPDGWRRRLLSQTAGIAPVIAVRAGVARLVLRGSALRERAADLLAALSAILEGPLPADPARLRLHLAEEMAVTRARAVRAGHLIADLRLRAGWSAEGAIAERAEGWGRLPALANAEPGLAGALAECRNRLFAAGRIVAGVSGGVDPGVVAALIARCPPAPAATGPAPLEPAGTRWGIDSGAPVTTVGQGADLKAVGLRFSGAHFAALRAVETGWLWDRVRVAGGAYGVKLRADSAGRVTFLSFRDPRIAGTLADYAGVPGWLARADAALVERSLPGALGQAEPHLRPDAWVLARLLGALEGETDDDRRARVDGILSARPADFHTLAAALAASLPGGPVVVLGDEARLRAALEERPGLFSLTG